MARPGRTVAILMAELESRIANGERIELPVFPPSKICSHCKQDKAANAYNTIITPGGWKLNSRCRECNGAHHKKWNTEHERDGRHYHDHHLQRTYGLTIEEYERMVVAQGGGCAICGASESAPVGIHGSPRVRRLCVDHDHETGRVRALLCVACNRGIGYLRHDIRILETAIAYLKAHDGK